MATKAELQQLLQELLDDGHLCDKDERRIKDKLNIRQSGTQISMHICVHDDIMVPTDFDPDDVDNYTVVVTIDGNYYNADIEGEIEHDIK